MACIYYIHQNQIISFSPILPFDEIFYVAKSFQKQQNHTKSSIFHYSNMNHRQFVLILQYLKCFCYIEKLIDWQISQKSYKKQTLVCFKYLLQVSYNSTPKHKARTNFSHDQASDIVFQRGGFFARSKNHRKAIKKDHFTYKLIKHFILQF